jgi:transposase
LPFTKRLESGVFLWPPNIEPGRTLKLSAAQLSALIHGIDWRARRNNAGGWRTYGLAPHSSDRPL